MKKSLVLAMAMALGVTASAYAANPFSDVPAGHWAYDSISKLAAAGVVEGYPDGSFKGENLMTRYEMAQIVAKAMAKGANVDALAAEFADELDNLGVRVAALEKKADNVQITGEIRYLYENNRGNGKGVQSNTLRSRLFLAGQVNDDWSYHAMLENEQDFKNNTADEKIAFKEAYIEGKLGGLNLTAGRYNSFLGDGNIWDARVEGAEVSYGSKIKVTGFVGKTREAEVTNEITGEDELVGLNYKAVEVSAPIAKNITLIGGMAMFDGKFVGDDPLAGDLDIWHVGAKLDLGSVGLGATYLHGKNQLEGDNEHARGIVINATYKGAEPDQPGSWGLFANYYNQDAATFIPGGHTTDAETFDGDGFKGYGVGANYTFAKNIVGTIAYYDTKSKDNSSEKCHKVWSELTFTF